MEAQPIACVWVSAFVCLSLMSGNEGQYRAISKHGVTQALVMIRSLTQSALILRRNGSVQQKSQQRAVSLTSAYLVTHERHRCEKDKKEHREEGVCERDRGSAFEKESECWGEQLSSVAVAQGGLAFTNPFFFDLFIQMKEQRRAGLRGTITLSPQTMT